MSIHWGGRGPGHMGRRTTAPTGSAAPIPLRSIATHGEVPVQVSSAISTAAQLRKVFRTRHYIGEVDATTMKLGFANWYSTASGELIPGNSCDIEAAVEFPGGSTAIVRFPFSGVDSITAADGDTVFTDAINASAFGLSTFPAGTAFWVRHQRTIASGGKMVRARGASSPSITGEGAAQSDNTVSQLMTAGALSTSGSYTSYSERIRPLIIVGQTAGAARSVYVGGTSIEYGSNDTAGDGANGAGGYVQRALADIGGKHIAYGLYATPSERIQTQAASATGARRYALMQYFTHFYLGAPTNDTFAGRTPAQMLTDCQTLYDLAAAAGIQRIEQELHQPRTTGAWALADGSDQTYASGFGPSSNAATFDTNVTASIGSHGLAAVLDFKPTVGIPGTPWKWIGSATAGTALTADGLHASPFGHGSPYLQSAFATRVGTWSAV